MKLQDQVCSLELSKRLKELGIKQESLFWWTRTFTRKSGEYKEDSEWYLQFKKNGIGGHYSAFTVAELGELLPMPIDKGGGRLYRLWINRELIEDKIEVIYVNARNSEDYFLTVADTEADARAKMLIYLLKNKLITP